LSFRLTASFKEMVDRELLARAKTQAGPTPLHEHRIDHDLPEEQYQCSHCQVFTYLSQIVCSSCSQVTCHLLANHRCGCPPEVPRTLRLRYTSEELVETAAKIADNAALPTNWRLKFARVLESGTPNLKSLRALVLEAEQIEKMTSLPELDPLRAFVGQSLSDLTLRLPSYLG
jgi:histone demethylase JARID1